MRIGPDAGFRDQQRAAEGWVMVGQSDQRHRRNDRSRGCSVLLLYQGVILFAIPIVADLDDAGIISEVHTGFDGFSRREFAPLYRLCDLESDGLLRLKRKAKGNRKKATTMSPRLTFHVSPLQVEGDIG